MAFSLAAVVSLATQLTMIAWRRDSAEANVRWVCAFAGFVVPLVLAKALLLFQHTEFVTSLLDEPPTIRVRINANFYNKP